MINYIKHRLILFKKIIGQCNYNNLIYFVIFYAIFIRVYQYIGNRSLWLDEAYLALAIRDHSFAELLQPLDFNQSAPIGFIYLTKILIEAFSCSEYILRLVPLIASILSIFIFYNIVKKYFSGVSLILLLALFSASKNLVFFSQEFKPYSVDVLVLLILFSIYFKKNQKLGNSNVTLYLIGAAATFFSFASIFSLFAISTHWIVKSFKDRNSSELKIATAVSFLWMCLFGVNYFLFIHNDSLDHYMHNYWRNYFLLFPLNIEALKHCLVLLNKFLQFSGFTLFQIPLIIFLIFCGAVRFVRQKNTLVYLILLTFFFLILASTLQKYPFYGRLLLFAIPMLYILIFHGFSSMHIKEFPKIKLSIVLVLLSAIIGQALLTIKPFQREEIKPLLQVLNNQKLKEDRVYFYYGASPAAFYYLGRDVGGNEEYIFGIRSRENKSSYLEDIEKLSKYRRVWLFFSHDYGGEKEYFLKNIDGEILQSITTKGAELYLIKIK